MTPLGEQETRDVSVDRSQHGEPSTQHGEPSTQIVEQMLQDRERETRSVEQETHSEERETHTSTIVGKCAVGYHSVKLMIR